MPRRKPAPHASSHARRAIAGMAARMMAEDGIADFGTAKRKAARNLGFGDSEALPSNEEVEAELRDWQSLYQEEEQRERVTELRATALELMGMLADFRPYLTGGTLSGTAGRYAAIEIDLHADSSKDVEILLLSNGISYEIAKNRRQFAEAALRIEWNGHPVVLTVLPMLAERQQAKSGPGKQRARADEVAELLRAGDK